MAAILPMSYVRRPMRKPVDPEAPRTSHPDTPRLFRDPWGGWHWKPEKRLRPHFRNVAFGKRFESARDGARQLNRDAAAWLVANGAPKRPARPAAGPRTVGQVVELFRLPENPAWRRLRERTQAQYHYELNRIHDEFGHEPAATLTKARVLGWSDKLAFDAPGTASHIAARGRSLFNWAIGKGHVIRADNPFEKLGLAGGGKRPFRFVWDDIAHILRTADAMGVPSVGVALAMGFATVQRITDVIAFTDDIRVSQIQRGRRVERLVFDQSKRTKVGKGGKLEARVTIDMAVPALVSDLLAKYPPRLALAPGDAPGRERAYWIVSEETGRAYHEKTISRVFARVLARAMRDDDGRPLRQWAHLAGGQLRDGRRSGFVHRIEQGAKVEQVCAVSGHDISEGYAIVSHYLPRTTELADQAEAFMTVRL